MQGNGSTGAVPMGSKCQNIACEKGSLNNTRILQDDRIKHTLKCKSRKNKILNLNRFDKVLSDVITQNTDDDLKKHH